MFHRPGHPTSTEKEDRISQLNRAYAHSTDKQDNRIVYVSGMLNPMPLAHALPLFRRGHYLYNEHLQVVKPEYIKHSRYWFLKPWERLRPSENLKTYLKGVLGDDTEEGQMVKAPPRWHDTLPGNPSQWQRAVPGAFDRDFENVENALAVREGGRTEGQPEAERTVPATPPVQRAVPVTPPPGGTMVAPQPSAYYRTSAQGGRSVQRIAIARMGPSAQDFLRTEDFNLLQTSRRLQAMLSAAPPSPPYGAIAAAPYLSAPPTSAHLRPGPAPYAPAFQSLPPAAVPYSRPPHLHTRDGGQHGYYAAHHYRGERAVRHHYIVPAPVGASAAAGASAVQQEVETEETGGYVGYHVAIAPGGGRRGTTSLPDLGRDVNEEASEGTVDGEGEGLGDTATEVEYRMASRMRRRSSV
ncbi:hypothetical protein M501DRAFT_985539 [Patellaria atrata CBS 101060]|uniref:Uncharacterized protein n=1 Tax=Patellaria atrata CBS 101060 TaxID=1346257 RepID=A0A9P4SKB9_9PEZI|nr:hypothetical protein M501DRAFT_985539 [Patellaria atrata CBS 101060]